MELYIKIFNRDLDNLATEIGKFENEQNLWKLTGEITNTAGNLCLHLLGNLNHFIGNIMGDSGYIREREKEFSAKDIPKSELLEMISKTKESLQSVFEKWDRKSLQNPYPMQVFGYEMTSEYFLIHLVGHLNYHTGQINYLRRIIDSK